MPNLVTIALAVSYAFLRSSCAPVVTSVKNSSSEHLPPRVNAILSLRAYSVSIEFSLGKYCANPREPLDRGITVSLRRGGEFSKNQLTTA